MSTHQHFAVCHCCELGSRACTCSNHVRKNILGRYLICSHLVNPEPLCSRRQHPGLCALSVQVKLLSVSVTADGIHGNTSHTHVALDLLVDFCPCSCPALSTCYFLFFPIGSRAAVWGSGINVPWGIYACLVCWLCMSRVLSADSGSCSARQWARLVCTPGTSGAAVKRNSLMLHRTRSLHFSRTFIAPTAC